ncbi:MAG TPA: PilZ domain-containing protein [Spirochaetota bacterium]|nr:PilZ domain-containing protein [Spirochaetota bacterium]HNT13065.1 PilZ domain-containing protein [Spirochaetota bacterium]HNV48850.1 PilZ domain-containing protein [Spirochaetota bacterium]HOS39233.1 PilZ domain-containing protein [Spirochaetota bacterium]HPI23302.1 PilZ domain-containing protein [Spirochaetota bacterium]
MSNKRKHDRANVTIRSEVRSPESITLSKTVNVSRGGLFISTPEPLGEGSELNLTIQVPGGEVLEIRGKVKWVRQNEVDGERAGMGIEFVDASDKDVIELKKIMD